MIYHQYKFVCETCGESTIKEHPFALGCKPYEPVFPPGWQHISTMRLSAATGNMLYETKLVCPKHKLTEIIIK